MAGARNHGDEQNRRMRVRFDIHALLAIDMPSSVPRFIGLGARVRPQQRRNTTSTFHH